jgi:hypothetical protein
MVAITIPYCLVENQLPKQSNGARGPPSSPWQSLWALVACTHLVVSLPSYDAVETAHSAKGLQAANMALPQGVILNIRYLIVW